MIDIFKSFRKVIAAFAIQPIIFQQGSSNRVFQSRGQHPTTFLNNMIQGSTHYPSLETMSYLENRVNKTHSHNTAQMIYQLHNFYLPMFYYLMHQRRDVLSKFSNNKTTGLNKSTFFVGISAPQGCGKTTLTEYLKILFDRAGLNCLSISLDDFYLTGAQQETLAAAHADNPLLQYRGNAGTHDLSLLLKTLHEAANATPGTRVTVPQYDKSLRSGRGDRVPLEQWMVVEGPVDVVLFEGWMLGFEPINAEDMVSLNVTDNVKEINELLQSYKRVHDIMDTWVILAVESASNSNSNNSYDNDNDSSSDSEIDTIATTRSESDNNNSNGSSGKRDNSNDYGLAVTAVAMEQQVYRWRLQAEDAMRKSGKPALTPSQVKDFVSRFMPAYSTYLPRLYRHGPQRRVTLLSQPTDEMMMMMKGKHIQDGHDNDTCVTSSTTITTTNDDNNDNNAVIIKDTDNSQVAVLKVVVDSNRAPIAFHELE